MYKDRGNPKILVRLPPHEIERLRRYAKSINRTMSDCVRDALWYYFELESVPEYTTEPAYGQIGIEDA